jgi:hypothetical protein
MKEPIDFSRSRQQWDDSSRRSPEPDKVDALTISHTRARYLVAMSHMRTAFLPLAPEQVAPVLSPEERDSASSMVDELRAWITRMERALAHERLRIV